MSAYDVFNERGVSDWFDLMATSTEKPFTTAPLTISLAWFAGRSRLTHGGNWSRNAINTFQLVSNGADFAATTNFHLNWGSTKPNGIVASNCSPLHGRSQKLYALPLVSNSCSSPSPCSSSVAGADTPPESIAAPNCFSIFRNFVELLVSLKTCFDSICWTWQEISFPQSHAPIVAIRSARNLLARLQRNRKLRSALEPCRTSRWSKTARTWSLGDRAVAQLQVQLGNAHG